MTRPISQHYTSGLKASVLTEITTRKNFTANVCLGDKLTDLRSPKTVKSAAFPSRSNDLSDTQRHEPSGAELMHQLSYQWHMFPQQKQRGTINNINKMSLFWRRIWIIFDTQYLTPGTGEFTNLE